MLVVQIILGVAIGIVLGLRLHRFFRENSLLSLFRAFRHLLFHIFTWIIILGPFALIFITLIMEISGKSNIELRVLSGVFFCLIYGPWIKQSIEIKVQNKMFQRQLARTSKSSYSSASTLQ